MLEAKLEEINPITDSSFYMIHQKEPTKRCLDFWHFHPEFELVYIPKGEGSRYIDNTISYFTNGDLFILGPNIPHNTFYYGRKSKDNEQYIIQIEEEKILETAKYFREFEHIKKLLHQARTGICIEHKSKHLIGNLISEMNSLKPLPRLLRLFEILEEFQYSNYKKNLNAGRLLTLSQMDTERIQKVFNIINDEHTDSLTTRRLAKELSMTETSFCRFFAKSTGKTFKTVLNEFRVQRACNFLLTTSYKINVISICVGFNSVPHFYKSFRSLMGTTPTEYRKVNVRVP